LELLENRTGIIITHRIAIASLADRIILLDDGEITEEGTNEELMAMNGEYCTMFEAQAGLYK
jgi:ATP-binding cassette subfamily B protein